MAAYENFVHIEGNLVKDPELVTLPSGDHATRITIAQSKRLRVDGQWVDGQTMYFDVQLYDHLARHAVETLGKGSRVTVDGELRQIVYPNKQTGEKVYKHEIRGNSVSLSLRFSPAMSIKPAVRAEADVSPVVAATEAEMEAF